MISSKLFSKFSLSNTPYYFSIFFIGTCFIFSIFSYLIIPDKTRNANTMNLNIQSVKPGFKVQTLSLPSKKNKKFSEYVFGTDYSIEQYAIKNYRFSSDSIYFTLYSKYEDYNDELSISLDRYKNNVPNNVQDIKSYIVDNFISEKIFYFGTDLYGRDLFSRVILGTRVSFSIGLMAVLISTVLGLFFGCLGGYFGGTIDKIVVYIINVFWSIPTLLLVIAISLSLGKGFWQVYIAIGFSVWVDVARLVRGKVISEKAKDYIVASKILGFNNFRIIISHIVPNILGPLLIIAAANFASSILLESGLSFLGIGTQPPVPSWGYMIKENYQYIILGNAYLAFIPAFFLVLLVSSFMFLSNYYSEKK